MRKSPAADKSSAGVNMRLPRRQIWPTHAFTVPTSPHVTAPRTMNTKLA